jgi:hypothetical protein
MMDFMCPLKNIWMENLLIYFISMEAICNRSLNNMKGVFK